MGSIDPKTGHQRIEQQEPGPLPEKTADPDNGTSRNFLPARSSEGGENSPNPIVDPDDPYNRTSGAGKGDTGTTTAGAGTTAKTMSPKALSKQVTVPPTTETETTDGIPAGDTRTTTAEDPLDASDSVAAGVSHPVETTDFARLQEAHQRVAPRSLRQVRKDEGEGFGTEISGTPQIGSTITAKITGVDITDKVWLRVKGPDQDSRVRCAHEGNTASQAVMITRPGTYVIGFEVNTEVVGETEFVVE